MLFVAPTLFFSSIVIIFTETGEAFSNYKTVYLENPEVCSPITDRKIKLGRDNQSGLILKQLRVLGSRPIPLTTNFFCKFKLATKHNTDGIIAVIQRLAFRKDEHTGECIDFIQFKSKNGNFSPKFCGTFKAEHIMDTIFVESTTLPQAINNTFIDTSGELSVNIFVSLEPTEENLDMEIAFTSFQSCVYNIFSYWPCSVRKKICIYSGYFKDGIINCPFYNCYDEEGCSRKAVVPAVNTSSNFGNKAVIGSVASFFLLFLIFAFCMFLCRKFGIICWSGSFANPETSQQPATNRVMEMNESPRQSQNISSPSAASVPIENEEDKDLPPSYESLFPSR